MDLMPALKEARLRLAVAGKEFVAEVTELVFPDGKVFVARTPLPALSRAHRLGELPRVLGCPEGYRAVPVMLSEPERRDKNPVRVPSAWELIRTEQGGAAH